MLTDVHTGVSELSKLLYRVGFGTDRGNDRGLYKRMNNLSTTNNPSHVRLRCQSQLTFRKNFSFSSIASKVVERVDNHSNWEETCLVTTMADFAVSFENRVEGVCIVAAFRVSFGKFENPDARISTI
jgi:tRNA A37 threonylcarbamoyltransferase TsaD